MITYDGLKIQMIKKEVTFKQLREDGVLNSKTIASLNNNRLVGLETLIKLATILECDIGDLVSIKTSNN